MKTEEQMEAIAKVISDVIRVLNELEDKVYKLEEIALNGKKATIEK